MHTNTNAKIVFATILTAAISFMILWACLSQHGYAAEPSAVEQYKIVYLTNSGEDAEATLNKLSVDGWKFKASVGNSALLLTKSK